MANPSKSNHWSVEPLLNESSVDSGLYKATRSSLVDNDGNQLKYVTQKLRVSSVPYTYDIAEGNITDHVQFSKIGFTPALGAVSATTQSDIWANGGLYTFPTAEVKMEAVSSSAGDEDAGVTIFSGTSNGGSTTSLIDTTKTFTGGTAVEVGDCILLDKSGTTPEWGYVTAVAATTLTVAGGFSSGGTGSGRAYAVLDKNSAGKTGAHAVRIEYLDDTYAQHMELVILDGDTAVDTVNTDLYRINSFRVIAGNMAVGNLTLRADGGGTTYSYILAGYARARNAMFTVPKDKVIYISTVLFSFGYAANQTHYARMWIRANIAGGAINFNMRDLFWPYIECVCANSAQTVHLDCPAKLPEGTDVKATGVASATGTAMVSMRGWMETA